MDLLTEIQFMETYVNESGELVLIAGDIGGLGNQFYTGTRKKPNDSKDTPATLALYDKHGVVQSKDKGGNLVSVSDVPWHNDGYHPFTSDPDRVLN